MAARRHAAAPAGNGSSSNGNGHGPNGKAPKNGHANGKLIVPHSGNGLLESPARSRANGHLNGYGATTIANHGELRVMGPDFIDEPSHLEDDAAGHPKLGIEPLVEEMLRRIGEDPEREGLLKTPSRVDKSLAFLTSGYQIDFEKLLNGAIFRERCDEMVVIKDIEFYSMCEHHMLPFFGVAHVGYIPSNKIIGLSKVPRIVEAFARRLQVQERLTGQIARCINEVLEPQGVAVITEARHLCMMMRGVQKQNSSTVASSMIGAFRHDNQTRAEFLSIVRQRQSA